MRLTDKDSTMDNYSDNELVDLANGGEVRALELLFERHYLAVYRLAYKWCGVKEDAEDVAQEVFVKLVRKLRTFGRKAAFKTWLYRIVVNTSRDAARRRSTRQARESAFVAEQAGHNPEPAHPNPSLADRLMAAVGQLPDRQREAVLLVLGEGLSHKEAARVLGCMEATVSWRIFQARKRLSIELGHKG